MLSSFDGIILDMDGVVIDSEPLHERAQRLIYEKYRLAVTDEAMQSYKGLVEREVFARVVRDFAIEPLEPALLIEEKNAAYRALMHHLELIPGVEAFLRTVRPHVRLGLTTSSIRDDQARAFERFGLAAWFDVLVTAEDVDRPKPDPQPYLRTAARLGLDPARCLVVEDSLNGVRSGKGAGCTVAGLTTSFGPDALRHAGADLVIDGYDELLAFLALPTPADEITPSVDGAPA